MSFLVDILAPAGARTSNATYRAYPTLKSARWILPQQPVYRRSAMAGYRPDSLGGRCLKALITTGLMRGDCAPGADAALGRLKTFIGDKLGISDIALGLAVGTPGAYQKHTLRIMNRDGAPIAYAKLADLDLAKRKIAAENANLAILSSVSQLDGQVPQLLFFGQIEACTIVLTTAGPDTPGALGFSADHERFLHAIHSALGTSKQLFATAFWAAISDRLDWLSTKAAPAWRSRFDLARRIVSSRLRDIALPLSLAHRDFTPWNTRAMSGRLFVFDWEDGMTEAPSLLDVLHFHAIQDALAGRRLRVRTERIANIYGNIVGLPAARVCDVRLLWIIYFLDLCSYYLRARLEAPGAGDSLVLDWAEGEFDCALAVRDI